MKELSTTQMGDILKNLLNAKRVELMAPTIGPHHDLCVFWEIPHSQLLSKVPNSFTEYFSDLLVPFGDLLRVAQTPRILELQGLLDAERENHQDTCRQLSELARDFQVYKDAIKDSKG